MTALTGLKVVTGIRTLDDKHEVVAMVLSDGKRVQCIYPDGMVVDAIVAVPLETYIDSKVSFVPIDVQVLEAEAESILAACEEAGGTFKLI